MKLTASIPRSVRILLATGVLGTFSSVLGHGQSAVQVNDPQPLAAFADRIQAIAGVPINYDDARYSNESDVVDVTSTIVFDLASHPDLRVLIPRGGVLSMPVRWLTEAVKPTSWRP